MNTRPASPRILVVDDEQGVRRLLEYVLNDAGYQVETANDGAAGWLALQANNYDLLITDNNMPILSGLEMVKNLRSAQLTLPVIMVSGALNPDYLSDLDLEPVLFLPKPFSNTDLLAKVKSALSGNLLPSP